MGAGRGAWLEPHLRRYRQSDAGFYYHALPAGEPLPRYAGADYRLGDFSATTLGVGYGARINGDSDWQLRLESYSQRAGNRSRGAGLLNEIDFPGVDAITVVGRYSLRW